MRVCVSAIGKTIPPLWYTRNKQSVRHLASDTRSRVLGLQLVGVYENDWQETDNYNQLCQEVMLCSVLSSLH